MVFQSLQNISQEKTQNGLWLQSSAIPIRIKQILSEIQKRKKRRKSKKDMELDEAPQKEVPKKKSAWENMSHGKNKADKK
jgi:hypothetical protein